ncbi:MAG: hypothetical protein WC007_15485 [Pelobacteraceae bacterium]
MIIRLTQKLAAKLGESPTNALPRDPDIFSDWTGHLFTANRTQYVILVNSATLYTVLMYGRGITDGGIFIDRLLSTLRDYMTDDDLPFLFHRFIVPRSATVSFSKTGDRSLLGSINDHVAIAKSYLIEMDESPFTVAGSLNSTPMKYLHYRTAREELLNRSVGTLES